MSTIFEILFGESEKVYSKEFNEALRQLPDISMEERKYLNEVFENDLKDGLTGYELKQRIEKLRHNYNDVLEPEEVEQVRKKLLGMLED